MPTTGPQQPPSHELPLGARVREPRIVPGDPSLQRELAELAERAAAEPELAGLGPWLARPAVRGLLLSVLAGSSYLASLIRREPLWLLEALSLPPRPGVDRLIERISAAGAPGGSGPIGRAELMRQLRRAATEASLLIALADIGGVWDVPEVTLALSDLADAAVRAAVRYLFAEAAAKGILSVDDMDAPQAASGYIVLAMGKYGARELNYSSDIDLIVFFEAARLRLAPGHEPLAFAVRLTKDLVRLIQERTADGYVFRTDLRLRPDAGATAIAISTEAALNYYESYGQNWERAAIIKARAVAGDIEAGEAFLDQLAPYVWRKYLDYAAIADIHAMKRQIHAVRGFDQVAVAGHNIKLGRGGIREIEFFAQTQQLIAGGRQTGLRTPQTLLALSALAARGWIKPAVRDELTAAYLFLRRIEHRLQMQDDEQTQTLPADPAKLERFARFSEFADAAEFAAALTGHLRRVQAHYSALFEHVPELTSGGGNMMFAGEADDPQTVLTLERMGFSVPPTIIATVRGWHHGRYPAVRSSRARERLTELQPHLIAALAATADPDAAFAAFDRFLAELPAGVQLFSLLRSNPNLLELIAAIMGTAPRLARILGRRRRVLDAVLDPGFFGTLPAAGDLTGMIGGELAKQGGFEETLDRARAIGSEQQFLIGVRVLTGTVEPPEAGRAYAQLAEEMIRQLQSAVEAELVRRHGRIAGGSAAVIAMGKLGGREMTASSDLDLIVVYDYPSQFPQSEGLKPLAGSQYFARMTQRLISALAAPTSEGSLYEVDMRLRPSGQKGPVATHLQGFIEYHERESWTWEHMALSRARVITGPPQLRAEVEHAIEAVLTQQRDKARTVQDVRDMRQLIFKEKGSEDLWELKQVRGGLIDLEFIAQHLQLVHAARYPKVLDTNTISALSKLRDAGLLSPAAADALIPAARLYQAVTQVLRLCLDGPFRPDAAPDGLKMLLARAGGEPDLDRLSSVLKDAQQGVAELFEELVA